MPSKPNDSLLSAASENEDAQLYATVKAGESEYAQLYAAVNFAQSKGGEDSSNAAEDAAIDQGTKVACVAAGTVLGVPPQVSAAAADQLAGKIKEERNEGNNKESSNTQGLGLGK